MEEIEGLLCELYVVKKSRNSAGDSDLRKAHNVYYV